MSIYHMGGLCPGGWPADRPERLRVCHPRGSLIVEVLSGVRCVWSHAFASDDAARRCSDQLASEIGAGLGLAQLSISADL
jgi:hypothetical protein